MSDSVSGHQDLFMPLLIVAVMFIAGFVAGVVFSRWLLVWLMGGC